jgi:SAM-dependent methyltransferase
VCELGSGAGTNLIHLHDYGYECFGYDSNQESIVISKRRAESNGKNIEFDLLDFSKNLPNYQFDAVVSLFVPISLEDMEKLAQSCLQILKPGGYFACMLLAVLPQFEDIPEHNVTSTEFLEVDGISVIRFNYYKKHGHQIQYDGVYFAGEPQGPRMFGDRDRYDLLTKDQMLKIEETGYRHICRTQVQGKPDQCPPMTYEVLDFFQKN